MENNEAKFGSQENGKPFKKKPVKHPGAPEKKLACIICGKKFAWKHSLSYHMKSHPSKEYKCAKCGKIFARKDILMQHMNTHLGDNKFPCSTCGKGFRSESGLRWHMNNVCSMAENVNNKVACIKMENVELQDKTSNIQSVEKTTDNVAALKCWVCGDDPGFKSRLMDQFKPQNMGFRYMCPRCDENLECADNLGDYFKTFNNLSEFVEDMKNLV